jgi:hypothetical protein
METILGSLSLFENKKVMMVFKMKLAVINQLINKSLQLTLHF